MGRLFSVSRNTSSNGDNSKLLKLYMVAEAHEETLDLVMKLSEEIRVIATQIPFFKLDKSNYPKKNIIMAQKIVFKRMVEVLPTYLMASLARPIDRQRALEEEIRWSNRGSSSVRPREN